MPKIRCQGAALRTLQESKYTRGGAVIYPKFNTLLTVELRVHEIFTVDLGGKILRHSTPNIDSSPVQYVSELKTVVQYTRIDVHL